MISTILNLQLGAALTFSALLSLLPVASPPATASTPIPRALTCLKQAYPKHICKVEPNHIVLCDGTRMIYDDGKVRQSHEEKLNTPSLKDAMSFIYPIGEHFPVPLAKNQDPGRIRYTPLFKKIYGDSGKAVRSKTRVIRWAPSGQRLRVSSVYDVHKKMEAVGKALAKLPKKYKKFVTQSSGTFVWRYVKGTKRRSLHSFAIAIDIGVKHSYYWNWTKPNADGVYLYKNTMPIEVVKIFEKHGFIWGGKWYHFDTMHFEYRPELLCNGHTLTKAQADQMAKAAKKDLKL